MAGWSNPTTRTRYFDQWLIPHTTNINIYKTTNDTFFHKVFFLNRLEENTLSSSPSTSTIGIWPLPLNRVSLSLLLSFYNFSLSLLFILIISKISPQTHFIIISSDRNTNRNPFLFFFCHLVYYKKTNHHHHIQHFKLSFVNFFFLIRCF